MMLDKVTGAECPQCGCEDSRLMRTRNGWGGAFESRSCNNCGKAFYVTVNPADDEHEDKKPVAVPYTRVACRCPMCGGENPRVVRTIPGGVRYHKCPKCSHTFKSYERSET